MKATSSLVALLIAGCFGCMTGNGNLVVLKNAKVVALGSVKNDSLLEIFEVSIGHPSDPLDQQFTFSIRLDSGRVIHSKAFTLELISSIANRTNVLNSSEWRVGYVSYGIDGYSFIFQVDQLVGFRAAEILLPNGTRLAATLGDTKGEHFFPLPLSEAQFLILFGKPESIERRKVN